MFEHLLTRQASVNGALMRTSLVGRLWRVSPKCALSNCLTPRVPTEIRQSEPLVETKICITSCSTWRCVSDEHPSSSLITATETDTSQENNERTETFTAGLPVIRAQSDGSVHSPVPRRSASLAV